ncbi:hypothetical protein C6P74_23980 [Burkholderia multivorans]|nr:hypothetical protein C6P74_23980 [Burkholderia multivorans]
MHKLKNPPPSNRLFCSFCAKSQNEVELLISGPGVYICNECTQFCEEIIQAEQQKKQSANSSSPSSTQAP